MSHDSELEIEALRDGNEVLGGALLEAEAKLATLRDLLREAAEALTPFKRVADDISSDILDSFCLHYQMGFDCEVGDAREARAVLAKIEEALK